MCTQLYPRSTTAGPLSRVWQRQQPEGFCEGQRCWAALMTWKPLSDPPFSSTWEHPELWAREFLSPLYFFIAPPRICGVSWKQEKLEFYLRDSSFRGITLSVVFGIRTVRHRPMYLNAWSLLVAPFVGAWGGLGEPLGCGALLEEVWHWRWAWEMSRLILFSGSLCFLGVVEKHPLTCLFCPPSTAMPPLWILL